MPVRACIFIFGMALFAFGIATMTAPADPGSVATKITSATTTTIEPTTTTTSVVTPITATTTEIPRPPAKNPPLSPVHLQKARAAAPTTAPSTTTTEAPKTPLEIAQSQVGKTGSYAEGGFWCDSFVSWVAQQAKVEGFISRDTPSALWADAKRDGRLTDQPVIGGMVFIDLFGPELGHGQVSHVGIVEYVDGNTIGILQGNGKPDPSIVTRTTYTLGDGYIVGFAPFNNEGAQ